MSFNVPGPNSSSVPSQLHPKPNDDPAGGAKTPRKTGEGKGLGAAK